MIGISIARTISITKPPTKIITNGSRIDKKTDLLESISFFKNPETLLNIFDKLPDLKPLEINWMNVLGKTPSLFKTWEKSFPSSTFLFISRKKFSRYLLLKTFEDRSSAVSKFAPDSKIKPIVRENLSSSEIKIKFPITGSLRIFLWDKYVFWSDIYFYKNIEI